MVLQSLAASVYLAISPFMSLIAHCALMTALLVRFSVLGELKKCAEFQLTSATAFWYTSGKILKKDARIHPIEEEGVEHEAETKLG